MMITKPRTGHSHNVYETRIMKMAEKKLHEKSFISPLEMKMKMRQDRLMEIQSE